MFSLQRLGASGIIIVLFAFIADAQRLRDLSVPAAPTPGSVLVIGILGGFEHWNDPHRGIRKVALSLRSLELRDVYVETIENHHSALALKLIKRFVAAQPQSRIILYGQSWGGAAVIHIARELQASRIPVCLTIQIDSVGLHDDIVPGNVENAANIFQHDLFSITGRQEIRAEDPGSTRILENTQLSYMFRPYSTLAASDASWPRRTFGGSHAKMEADDSVWTHVQALILSAIKNQL
jgi:pimeloyl-ACP methyl ester carboxylesterase